MSQPVLKSTANPGVKPHRAARAVSLGALKISTMSASGPLCPTFAVGMWYWGGEVFISYRSFRRAVVLQVLLGLDLHLPFRHGLDG